MIQETFYLIEGLTKTGQPFAAREFDRALFFTKRDCQRAIKKMKSSSEDNVRMVEVVEAVATERVR